MITKSDHTKLRFSVPLLCIVLSSLLWASPTLGQEARRILVVHGELESENWYRNFDRTLVDHFSENSTVPTVVASRTLELSRAQTPEIRQRIKLDLESEIQEIGYDVVVAVLPAATGFLLELENPNQVPFVLTVPDDAVLSDADLPGYVAIVKSSVRAAMEKTVEQILTLRPQTNTIEVIAGNHPTNLTYVDYVKEIAQDYTSRVQFNFNVGVDPDSLKAHVSQLPDTASVLTLPYFAYGDQESLLPFTATREVNQAASVPAFMTSDDGLELGAVGGHFTSSSAYAMAAADIAERALAGELISGVSGRDAASAVYDWNAVQSWNLPVNRLSEPYVLINEPMRLWQEYPIIAAVILNIILALLAFAIFQTVSLRRSERARLLVESSEKAARESEERYRLLAGNTLDVIWVWDHFAQKLKYCSPSVELMLGYTAKETIALSMEELMTPESVKRCTDLLYRSEPIAALIEVEYYASNGREVSCEIAVRPTKIENGVAAEWIGVTRDISQRKEDEQERRQLEIQVRQAQKFESLGTLAGGIAHDFNNILSVMMGTVDVLKENLNEDKDSSKLLSRLMSASEKAKSLVQQILTFSRQSENEKVVTNLNSLIDDCLGIMGAGIPNNIKLSKELCDQSLFAMGDQSQLSQVIVNLVTNAYESIDGDGQIKISLQEIKYTEEVKGRFTNLPAGHYAKLSVSDTGSGIAEPMIERIFDPFFTSKEMGNGMGLAIVHGIIVEHGGAIEIDSKEGKGTSFSAYLPLTDDVIEITRSDEATKLGSTSCRILVVDDQEELLEIFSSMLEALGHQCTPCQSVDSALYQLDVDKGEYDLIITDYSMPGKSGLELSKQCAKRFSSIPVIISTGYGEGVHDQIGPEFGIAGVLDKPFNLEKLKDVVSEHAQH